MGDGNVNNPFSNESEAHRYQKYRPRYHHLPMALIQRTVGKTFDFSLDVACGTGHSTTAITKISKKTVGCDISEPMLNEARKNFEIEFVKANAEILPFADATFDFLNISMGFHWVNQEKFLAEAKRVLRSDGYFAIDNYGFIGEISDDHRMQKAHKDFFETHLPPATRRSGYPTEQLVNLFSIDLVKELQYDHQVAMDADVFTNFLMTWSNFQILSPQQKLETAAKMDQLYKAIFNGRSLELKFGGKTMLYKFRG